MNTNNLMYTYFNNMLQGYKENNIDAIEQNARCLCQLAEENPFKYDTPEYEEFFQMKLCYTIWARGDINAKINRRKMVRHANALCALNPKQPYTWDKKAELEDKKEKEKLNQPKVAEETLVKTNATEPTIVLGVIPDQQVEKKRFNFFRFLKKEGGKNDSP